MAPRLKSPARIGKPGCSVCKGEGSYMVAQDAGPPAYQLCRCTLEQEILANAERGFRGLSSAPKVKDSPLFGRDQDNLWITAPKLTMLAHLRHVAIRKPPTWMFRVISDAQMMTAWLATASLAGGEIFDADARTVSLTHATLVDLIEPPELVVVALGIKAARNQAMPEVLLEALTHRVHTGRPTWLWDQPEHRLDGGDHLAYNEYVQGFLEEWERIKFTEKLVAKTKGKKSRPAPSTTPDTTIPSKRKRRTISDIANTGDDT
ncbi:hypothetical protein N9917_01320 [Deltaproteobacteria bacterium]|nr:hypothetical protein [Deltaproteobacteria bacterium]